MPGKTPRPKDAFGIFAAFTALAALFFGILAVYVAADDGSGGGTQVAAAAPVSVTLADMTINPDGLEAVTGDVTFTVTNEGPSQHDLTIEELGVATPAMNAGDTATLELGELTAGEYTVFCSIPGHRQSGMEGTLTVAEGGGAATATAAAAGHDTNVAADGTMDWQEMDRLMTESVADYPAETEGVGGAVLEPTTIEADGTKVFDLTAEIVDWEVEPGKIVEAWAYNGTVPAPTLDLEVGDHIKVNLQNDLPISTDIHWHGLKIPMDQDGVAPITQPFIEPGTSYTYEFTVDHVAVAMYHPHHHGYETVPNGMLGTVLVGDLPLPDGVTPVQEMSMVLNDAGTIGFALNGKSFPATAPIVVNEGEYVLVHYMNEGLTSHPMHLHRNDQLVVAKDGFPLPAPYYADTVNVAPGERYSVLIRGEEKGTWAYHCHILTHAERDTGMFGMVTTMIVQ
jgi:FtsP/CotA-like multicopper oxidase with cupredoxin domain